MKPFQKEVTVSSTSLLGRSVLAIVLFLGFYLLAFGIAAGLIYIPYAEWRYAGQLHIRLALGCLLGAFAILWSVFPRIEKFQAPGPCLDETRHVRLFRELETTAEAADLFVPSEIYLVPDMNAWVSFRGGILGSGSRSMMGLGLPLLQMLTVSELRAVLAHELGHFHGGDVSLAPWIYKTRSAISRTLQQLHNSVIQRPFIWYSKLFLRITNSVARRQEFAADALAARIVGGAPLISGLKKVHAGARAFDTFWRTAWCSC